MKKQFTTLLLSLLLSLSISTQAQNLVPNGDFEQYIKCPTLNGNAEDCLGWRQYTGGTSDYLHSCSSNPYVHTPENWIGYQEPASGVAYIGLIAYETYTNGQSSGWTEYITSHITALIPGNNYEVSMSVSLGDSSKYSTNGLGIFFYKDGPDTFTTTSILPVKPHISFASYGNITETQNWVRLTAKFKADSAYDNIVIGTFTPPTGLLFNKTSATYDYSYYYFDSISVRLIPGINIGHLNNIQCTGDTFYVPFTINTSAVLNSGNTFSVQLSSPSGSFQNGTTILGTLQSTTSGSIKCVVPKGIQPGNDYYIRILSSDVKDSSNQTIHKISIRSFDAKASIDLPICPADSIHLYATSSTPANYTWTGPNGYFSNNSDNYILGAEASKHNGRYTMVATGNGCTSTTSVDVAVTDTAIDLGPDEELCMNEMRLLKLNIPNAKYLWQDGSTTSTYTINKAGTYWVTATTECGLVTDTVVKEYEICECKPFIPTAFTPNGDGRNDKAGTFHIDCTYTNYKFCIANRYGQIIFTSSNISEKWDGTFKGQPAEVGTYFYLLQLTGPRGKDFFFKGDITLIR